MHARPDLEARLGWIHELARELVFDPDHRDEVVQESWLALRSAPAERARDPRAWTAAVVRNVARKLARGERRRGERERAGAKPERGPDPRELEERAELHKRLVDAVLALDEPFRSAVLERYFDGRMPRVIARSRGVPVATVDSWLRRGVERLRAELDAEYGDRRSWCLALLPLAKLAKGGFVGSPAVVGTAATLLLLLSGGGAYLLAPQGGNDATRQSEALAGGTSSSGVRGGPALDAQSAADGPREPATISALQPVQLLLRSAAGAGPVEGARVRWVDLASGARGETTTDADGKARLPGASKYALALEPRVELGLLATQYVDARGAELVLPDSAALEVECVDERGDPVAGVDLLFESDGSGHGWQMISELQHGEVEQFLELTHRMAPGNWPVERAKFLESSWSRILGNGTTWPYLEIKSRSDARGRVRFGAFVPGKYVVRLLSAHLLAPPAVEKQAYSPRNRGSSNLQVSKSIDCAAGITTHMRALIIAGGSLRGQLDTQGTLPPENVELLIETPWRSSEMETHLDTTARRNPDQAGRFEFPSLRPCLHTLHGNWTRGSESWLVHAEFEIEAGKMLDLGTLRCADVPLLELQVDLVDLSGRRVPPERVFGSGSRAKSVEVHVTPDANARSRWNAERPLAVGEIWTLHGIDAHSVNCDALLGTPSPVAGWHIQPSWNRTIELPARGLQLLQMRVEELSRFEIELVLPDGSKVYPRRLDGVYVDRDSPDWSARVEAGGHATVFGRPGPCWINVRDVDNTGLCCESIVQLVSGAPLRVELVHGASIEGRLSGTNPQSSRGVFAMRAQRSTDERSLSSDWSCPLNDLGRFHFSNLPPHTEILLWTERELGSRRLRVRTGAPGETVSVEIP